ncbi:MAG: branched-chain amino acid ABC transporter permease [Nitrospinae bacterium]|nr:branched-chain amino acid ABC transporter permease [Nitrospinota bacterium]
MLFYLMLSGLTNGSLYALVAMGLVIIYKATAVVNFAHGEVFMMGGFFGYTFHVLLGLPYPASLLLAVGLSLLLGVVTERVAYRPMIKASVISLVLASVGFSFVLKGIARVPWGGKGDFIPFPPVFSYDPIVFGSLLITPQHLIILTSALACMGLFAAFFRWTKLGKMMQATAENQRAAALVGIRVERVFASIWGAGACVGAVAGVLMAPVTLLYPDIGATLLVKAFASAVLGGFGSLPGAVLGGLTMGLVENLAGGYLDTSLVDISPFLVMILVLILWPTGFFGARAIRKV